MCARPIGSERERRPFAKTSVEGETCLRSRKGRTLEMSSYGDARLREQQGQISSSADERGAYSLCTSTNQVLDDSAEQASTIVALGSLSELVDDDERARGGVAKGEPVA